MKSNIPEKEIALGELKIKQGCGTAGHYIGRHSGLQRARLSIEVTVPDADLVAQVDELFEAAKFTVYDPFKDRQYEASARLESESYRDGYPEHHYRFSVDEIDPDPKYDAVEIEGEQLAVSRSKDHCKEDGTFDTHLLLSLSEAQLYRLYGLWTGPEDWRIKRIGVDSEARACTPTWFSWSHHPDQAVTPYKLALVVVSPRPEAALPVLAQGDVQEALAYEVCALKARFEATLSALQARGSLGEQEVSRLTGFKWRSLVSPDRVKKIEMETRRVADAACYMHP